MEYPKVHLVGKRPDYTLIKGWLEHCTQHHFNCQPHQSTDLERISVVDVWRRVIVPLPSNGKYLALSYVWGSVHQPACSTGESLPSQLPKTIEDSITVVRALGQSYL
ncbi:hypothetical protein K469DRAFT_704247 [Zopfia rhizophila CBS 207.26]|uniref:Heterokaryon incompatibility domain-containing protein n=1 Tax=Zopfia rhizophila CBS 207.26 TaxID=1314779 RepID=A0A6A6EAY5_9PEZI|nr:hypothetical protein K469DRAFT_704247 [Zopfia rhizophila CBS 207.26]